MLYHEVQESKLCAMHCVNTALQGPFFSEFDLAALASDPDLQGLSIMKKRSATCEWNTRFVGNLLKGQTVGVIGAGRIGSAYARMMVEGFKMNLIFSLPRV